MSMTDPMNWMNFSILDTSGESAPAGAAFIYKGFIISMSTVFRNPSVAVFVDAESEIVYDARSVEDAIEWVNNNGN